MTADLMTFYTGNQVGQVPGLLPQPYYWWEAGALMGALIDYWYYTGDTTYNDITTQGMLHQVGPYNDYMPPNQTLTEGNDDQGFWGMAAMSAAEYNFPNPPNNQPQWLALAQAVFNTQAARWDPGHCNGGLRWQIFTWNNGYDYKNSISQACFFNLAARLALYTGNSTYADWAVKTWDWMVNSQLMDKNYRVYDGAHIEDNCSIITPYEFSYNVGAFMLGAAAMVEYTNQTSQTDDNAMWSERVDGILNSTQLIFFYGNDTSNDIMIEIACEPVNLCDTDQQSFKAYLSRWMAATTKWAPWTLTRIKTLLQNSAEAAATQCTGGQNGRMCGLKWANNSGQWDGTTGVGQQMAAMEVVLANMIHESKPPVTNATGGTSVGNPAAGGSDQGRVNPTGRLFGSINDADRAGAAILTFTILTAFLSAIAFMLADEKATVGENWNAFRSSMTRKSIKGAGVAVLAELGKGKGRKTGGNGSGSGSGSGEINEKVTNTDKGKGKGKEVAFLGKQALPPPAGKNVIDHHRVDESPRTMRRKPVGKHQQPPVASTSKSAAPASTSSSKVASVGSDAASSSKLSALTSNSSQRSLTGGQGRSQRTRAGGGAGEREGGGEGKVGGRAETRAGTEEGEIVPGSDDTSSWYSTHVKIVRPDPSS
ncbi:glycosyl hydrolase family 76-domain-containing protein [Xylariaceae sp. FL0255]|nr:glycosyl hydrolase family 76-domain-containing protein [Xylariaceae sp. FL0255]